MYRFLDRACDSLAGRDRFLLGAMRAWAGASDGASGGAECAPGCPLARLAEGFAAVGAADAAGDFAMAMAALHCDGVAPLAIAPAGAPQVRDDEARLLALFGAPEAGEQGGAARRIAAALVAPGAVPPLLLAVARLDAQLADAAFPPTTGMNAEF